MFLPANDPENETRIRKGRPAKRAASGRGRTAMAPLCVILALLCLARCAGPQTQPAVANSATVSRGAGSSAAVDLARKQDWNCPRIRQTIANLIPEIQAAKARAEHEQAQTAQTLARMAARFASPPGAGNAALAAFQKAHRDADQLNDLLREKVCATVPIGVDAPAFLKS